MSIFEKDFLRRVKSPKAPAKTQEPLQRSVKVSEQHSLEQQPARVEQLEQVIQKHQLEQEKGGWRSSAKWLEQNFEEFREPICSSSEPARLPPTAHVPQSPRRRQDPRRARESCFPLRHLSRLCRTRSGKRSCTAIRTVWFRVLRQRVLCS